VVDCLKEDFRLACLVSCDQDWTSNKNLSQKRLRSLVFIWRKLSAADDVATPMGRLYRTKIEVNPPSLTGLACLIFGLATQTGTHHTCPILGGFCGRKLLSRCRRKHGSHTYAACCLARRKPIRTVVYRALLDTLSQRCILG
jgi:hypothetical protein